jgi:hypothetical protein
MAVVLGGFLGQQHGAGVEGVVETAHVASTRMLAASRTLASTLLLSGGPCINTSSPKEAGSGSVLRISIVPLVTACLQSTTN